MSASGTASVAYFCMEYGLHHSFTIYSGGLGVLAGDYMKSAGDLQRPVTGIGILWGRGYTTQRIGADGRPQDDYPPTRRDCLEAIDVSVAVTVRGENVPLRAYRVTRWTTAPLYLLEPMRDEHRWITERLYGGGPDDRVAQEIVLGVGGVRLLEALGIEPDLFHFNEGHAVFAGLELVRRQTREGATFRDATEAVRDRIVFTTHTPVSAGNEVHRLELLRQMGAAIDVDDEQLAELGGSPFSMTEAGLRLSRKANAVAELHGDTARSMWRHVAGGAPIVSITNGVHRATWQDPRIRAARARDKPGDQQAAELWQAHAAMKRQLLDVIRDRNGARLREDRLLVGFARRAAPYKRADLIFSDPARLEALLDGDRLQLVFAGKAHPADARGKDMVSRLVQATARWPRHVVFLENYDMELGGLLTRSCDVWLNNPRRPMEASGTSGMKAAMNGVLNVSILDGWWPEGCRHGETGWQIGDGESNNERADTDAGDRRDASALYRVFGDEVMPRYYGDRESWIGMMQNSIAMSEWKFSSDRMVEDYYNQLYAR